MASQGLNQGSLVVTPAVSAPISHPTLRNTEMYSKACLFYSPRSQLKVKIQTTFGKKNLHYISRLFKKLILYDCVISLLGIFLKEITCDVDDYQRLMQKKCITVHLLQYYL